MTISKLKKFPTVPEDLSSIVKPEELVDIVEMSPLTLQDRRIYNLLIGNAWNSITKQTEHTISRQELTKYVDSNNQDIGASIQRLMSTIVVIKIRNNSNGQPSTRRMQLLGETDIEHKGPIKYRFPPALVKIIKDTQIFARLHTQVMFQLSSKYSLALYEFLQRRKNLQYVTHETLTLEEVRGLLGIPSDKLTTFGNLNIKALKPAVKEVSFLTEYEITAKPMKNGRAVTHIKFAWERKRDIGAQIAAVEELERSKVGRTARMNKTSESEMDIRDYSQKGNSSESPIHLEIPQLTSDIIQKAKEIALNAGTGWDIYAIEQQFYELASRKGLPDNFEGAWLGFVKQKVLQTP